MLSQLKVYKIITLKTHKEQQQVQLKLSPALPQKKIKRKKKKY